MPHPHTDSFFLGECFPLRKTDLRRKDQMSTSRSIRIIFMGFLMSKGKTGKYVFPIPSQTQPNQRMLTPIMVHLAVQIYYQERLAWLVVFQVMSMIG